MTMKQNNAQDNAAIVLFSSSTYSEWVFGDTMNPGFNIIQGTRLGHIDFIIY